MPRNHNNRHYMRTFHKGDYKSPHAESYIIYGEGTPIIPDHRKGCQFKVGELFCNAETNQTYCHDHARICGVIYKR